MVSTYDYNIQYTCSLSIGIQFILENISRADINYRPDIRAITGQHVNTRISQLPMFLPDDIKNVFFSNLGCSINEQWIAYKL